ncbi:MAG: helix-turn-helix transcriptional regulator [Clostridia bacterium]|nr:helix-turn-helix transcriptional regulator [Clostridia bacterium]
MKKSSLSPYIRVAMQSTLISPFIIRKRVIFDYEIIFVEDGECNIIIDGVSHLCKKNNVVLLRPGVPHQFECINKTNFVQPHIHFDLIYNDKSEETFISYKAKDKMTDYELSLIQKDILKEINIPNVFTPYDIEKFKKIFYKIIELFQNKGYNYEFLYKAKMLELIDLIFRQFEPSKPEESTTSIIDDCITPIKSYIENNYLELITLDSLSKQFYVNKYTLLRRFKALYNQNIMEYYRNLRLEYAKEQLLQTDIPIKIIYEKLNYSDIYSFSRFFKSRIGCSPRLFRQNNRNSD